MDTQSTGDTMSQSQLNKQMSKDEAVEKLLAEINQTPAVEEVFNTFEFEEVVEGISAYGKRIRTSKPEDEDLLTQYVWRQAKFNCSQNDSIPVMADSWLRKYIKQNTSLGRVNLRNGEGEEIKDALDLVMMAAAVSLGHDPTSMAKRMDGVIY
jgi:hypothetical protein